MKVIVIRAHDKFLKGANPFIVGVFSTEEKADYAIEAISKRWGKNYHFSRAECEVDKLEVGQSEPDVSYDERLEALEQYMNVAQNKIMALQSNLDFMLYLHRDEVGHAETRRRMDQVGRDFGRHK